VAKFLKKSGCIVFRGSGSGQSSSNQYPALEAYRASWSGFWVVGFFSFFVNLGALASPLYMQQIFDRVIQSRHLETLIFLTLIVLFFLAVIAVIDAIRGTVLAKIGHWWDETVHSDLVVAIIQLARSKGVAHNHAASDLMTIRQFIGGPGVLPFFDAPWMPLFLLAVTLIHPWFGIAASIAAFVLFLLAVVTDVATRKRMEGLGARQSKAQTTLDVATRHADSVHSMGMLEGIMQRFREDNTFVRDAMFKVASLTAKTAAASKFVRFSAQIAVLGLGAYLATIGEITAGGMIAASIIMGRALAPAEQAMGAWRGLVAAKQAHRRIQDVLKSAPVPSRRTLQPEPKGQIEFRNLSYYLPSVERPILRGLNISFEPGSVIAIVGQSGSGKSTLCKMLIGAYEPSNGSIRMDGVAINNWDPRQFSKNVGYLAQSVQLLDGTIRENIARMGEANDELLLEAARIAGCHDMINQLPQAYDTPIGANGVNLSGGQAQRIGLARAIYGRPRLVILDEPNSNLDAEGDASCQKAIQELRSVGTTVFIVSHKPAALAAVDLVVTIKDGVMADPQTREDYLKSAIRPVSDALNRIRRLKETERIAQ
jgi:ATP-binding cassette, subfamily C, type I secretion system permease/ATPase